MSIVNKDIQAMWSERKPEPASKCIVGNAQETNAEEVVNKTKEDRWHENGEISEQDLSEASLVRFDLALLQELDEGTRSIQVP